MAKKGAPYGNKNAMGPHDKGYGAGTLGGAFGPVGSFASGLYTGMAKNATGMKKHNRAATVMGGTAGALSTVLSGAALGGAALGAVTAAHKGSFWKRGRNANLGGAAGALGTMAIGAAAGAVANYAGAKVGQFAGKRATSNYRKRS
jgi:hypothetical protein